MTLFTIPVIVTPNPRGRKYTFAFAASFQLNRNYDVLETNVTLRCIRVQLVLLAVLSLLEAARAGGCIPPPAEILRVVGRLIAGGGWWLLLLVSFAEHLAGVNVYFPGSMVIFVAVSSLAGKPEAALLTVLATITGAVLAHQVNFFLGRRLRGRSPTQQEVSTRPTSWRRLGMAVMFWHPHLGALTAIVAGREGVRYRTAAVTIIVSTVFWQALWGLFAYNAGRGLVRGDLGFWPMIGCVLIWAGVDLWRCHRKRGPQEPR